MLRMMAGERRPVIFPQRHKYGAPSRGSRRPSIQPPTHIQLPAAEMKRPARDAPFVARRRVSDPLHLPANLWDRFELAVTDGAPGGGPDT